MFRVNESTAEIFIYDSIGDEMWGMVSDGMVIEALSQLEGRRISLRINSDGGDVFKGAAIYNALQRHPGGVDTFCDGLAASCASCIFMAGQNRTIAGNAFLMLHNPWTIVGGTSAELRKVADTLDIVTGGFAKAYQDVSGKKADEIQAIFDAETWYKAEDAVEEGFATAIGHSVIRDKEISSEKYDSIIARMQSQQIEKATGGATPRRTAALLKARLRPHGRV